RFSRDWSSDVCSSDLLGPNLRSNFCRLRGRPPDDRQFRDPRSPAWCERKKRGPKTAVGDEPDPRCMGRSRGGLTTKIHALVDAKGRPVVLKLTPGQARSEERRAGKEER